MLLIIPEFASEKIDTALIFSVRSHAYAKNEQFRPFQI